MGNSERPLIVMTGVSRGIGREIFALMAPEHDIVGFVRHSPDFSGNFITQDLSETIPTQVLAQLDAALAGREVRAFIHCAGTLGRFGKNSSESRQDFVNAMNVNFHSAMDIIQICLPHMLKRKNAVTPYLLYMSTGAAATPISGLEAYCTSKAAAQMAMRCLSKKYSPQQLHVLSVAPGLVDTEMLQQILDLELCELPDRLWFEELIAQGAKRSPATAAKQIFATLRNWQDQESLHGNLLDFIDPENPTLIQLDAMQHKTDKHL
jgi:benzil reductase ((S)-benzoin forming)